MVDWSRYSAYDYKNSISRVWRERTTPLSIYIRTLGAKTRARTPARANAKGESKVLPDCEFLRERRACAYLLYLWDSRNCQQRINLTFSRRLLNIFFLLFPLHKMSIINAHLLARPPGLGFYFHDNGRPSAVNCCTDVVQIQSLSSCSIS